MKSKLRLFSLLLGSILVLIVSMGSGSASAISYFQSLKYPFYDASGSIACNPAGGALPNYISDPWNSAFTQAGNKHHVAPALLAALFSAENFTYTDPQKLPEAWANFHHDPNSGWLPSSSGAEGPFQFLPTTWGPPTNFGEDGDGDGTKDVNNLMDAAFGAANYAETDGATIDKSVDSWKTFIYSYNHADWYVKMVLDYYAFYASGDSPSNAVSPSYCGGGVSPDGFVFPQLTTKAQLTAQKPYTWNPNCVNPISSMGPNPPDPAHPERRDGLCHHDYLAADIFNNTGVAVVSPRPGKVVSYHDSGDIGWTIRIYSDPKLGGDGFWYYLAHMLKPSEGGKTWVSVGDNIKAGQQVGQVGTDADAQGTERHTHIDVSPVDNGFSRGYDGTTGPLLDPQPALKASYQALPES